MFDVVYCTDLINTLLIFFGVVVKYGIWPTFLCKLAWRNVTYLQSYSHQEGTHEGTATCVALF